MKVLVFGATGFAGSHIAEYLDTKHEVHRAGREKPEGPNAYGVDLEDIKSVEQLLSDVQPEAIINCAGVVENTELAQKNVEMTRNILQAVVSLTLRPRRIVITGSASEFGEVAEKELPVNESNEPRPKGHYASAKTEEVRLARTFAKEHDLPVIVARIFNPLGERMPKRMILPRLLTQLDEIRKGDRRDFEVTRADTIRDYFDMIDAAEAVGLLISGEKPNHLAYNIGSGEQTSTGQLIEVIMQVSELDPRPAIRETMEEPEPLVASQADISRIADEFNWSPKYSLKQTIERVLNAS